MNRLANAWGAIRTGFRRLIHGPRRPSWSWWYESFIAQVRRGFTRPIGPRLHEARREIDQFGTLLLRPGLARFTPTEIGGVTGLWAEPEQGQPIGMILYLHGGAYVFGSVESHRSFLAELAHRAGTRVLGINYRLAPEYACPAAIEDVLAVYRALLNQGEEPRRIVFAGDSAGGGLTLSSLVALRENHLPLPAGAVLISPWTDLTMSGASIHDNPACDIIHEPGIREVAGPAYYSRDLGPSDPRVSPLFADLTGLPPLRIFVGGAELLLDDSRRLADRARAAGVEVELHVEPDEVHVYPTFVGYSVAAEASLNQATAFIRERLQG